MREAKILVVDDDARLVRLLRSELGASDYCTYTAHDGTQALQIVKDEDVDLVVLDVIMPDMDGFETCRRIRALSPVPIIILTADADQSSKVKGLSAGADDYLTKPFDPEELLARIRAVLRRTHPASEGRWAEISASGTAEEPPFVCGELRVDYVNRTVTLRGEEVKLSPTEYRLLCQLTRNAGRVLPHEYLLTTVWGPEFRDDVKYLWVYIGYLREKLEADPKHPQHILTVPGFGYRFRKVR